MPTYVFRATSHGLAQLTRSYVCPRPKERRFYSTEEYEEEIIYLAEIKDDEDTAAIYFDFAQRVAEYFSADQIASITIERR